MSKLGKKAERITERLFGEELGIALRKLREDSTKKNPDFAAFAGPHRVATIEVKALGDTSPEPIPLEVARTKTFDESIEAGTRDDTNVARIAKKIHEGAVQFEGVEGPRGLVLYNEDFADHNDLRDALQDGLIYSNGERVSTLAKPNVHKQLKIDRAKIDFYVWIQNEPHQSAPVLKKLFWMTAVGEKLWHEHLKRRASWVGSRSPTRV